MPQVKADHSPYGWLQARNWCHHSQIIWPKFCVTLSPLTPIPEFTFNIERQSIKWFSSLEASYLDSGTGAWLRGILRRVIIMSLLIRAAITPLLIYSTFINGRLEFAFDGSFCQNTLRVFGPWLMIFSWLTIRPNNLICSLTSKINKNLDIVSGWLL